MHIKLEQIGTQQAHTISEQIKKLGGEAVFSEEANNYTARNTDMILSSTKSNLVLLAKKLASRTYDLEDIAKGIEKCIDDKTGLFLINNKSFDFVHNTYLSGVVHYKKQLFSSAINEDKILSKIEKYMRVNVDIIELKGKTITNNMIVDAPTKEEINSIAQLIYKIKKRFPGVTINIDATQLPIVKTAIENGANLITNYTPIRYNQDVLKFLGKVNIPLMISLASHYDVNYKSYSSAHEILREIQANITIAQSNTIARNALIIDPSITFTRKNKDNYLSLRQLSSFKHLKIPTVVSFAKANFLGASLTGKMPKTMISNTINNLIAIINSANIIRCYHPELVEVLKSVISTIQPTSDNHKSNITN